MVREKIVRSDFDRGMLGLQTRGAETVIRWVLGSTACLGGTPERRGLETPTWGLQSPSRVQGSHSLVSRPTHLGLSLFVDRLLGLQTT
jgi:hypothetical protein